MESEWADFEVKFKLLNPNFISNLFDKHPDLTKSEIRLLILIRIGYSQKEIAEILNIAPDSVKKSRSRVRKKLNLGEDDALNSYLAKF
jgi:two-component system, sensor histidine kinase LadS